MNVLMIGGANRLMNQLIRKMEKEGHRVYLLTGSRFTTAAYAKVFERYELTYDSESLSDVFESINPDVTIFTGAFDSNFRWSNEERELVRLTSSLTNLLTSHIMASKGQFIYLSSDEVYAQGSDVDIEEDVPASPNLIKGMALAQCEDICESFRKNRDADIVVLRIDHLYVIPNQPDDAGDICCTMCLEALRDGKITVNSNHRISLLYEADAVEFIFKLVRNVEHKHSIYNISSSQELTERDIARYIQIALGDEAGITIEESAGEAQRCILSNKRFDEEFGVRIFANPPETVGKLAKHMAAHKQLFLSGEAEKKPLLKRIAEKAKTVLGSMFPYVENLVFFVLVLLLSGSPLNTEYLQDLDLFLLYVLLFAAVYGQHQATFAALLAVIGSYLTQLQSRSFLAVAMDYNTYIWIAQLFIVGLVVGYLKDQIRKLNQESEEEQHFLNRQLSDIKDINYSNVRVKDALETEIVNQRDSIGKVYQITSSLEQYMPEEVLFYAAEIMRDLLGSDDIAIYTVSNNSYARLFTFTSERAKGLGKSVRYRELGEVYESLAAHKVFINRDLDKRYPMMANAIFNGDDIQTMIMVWGLPWERMTLGQADMLTVVSYLIQNAVVRATQYIAMLENRRYQEGGRVMETEPFTSLVRAFLTARNKNLTECAILRVDVPQNAAKLAALSAGEGAPAAVASTVIDAPAADDAPEKKDGQQKKSLSSALNKYVSIVRPGRKKEEAQAPETAAPAAAAPAEVPAEAPQALTVYEKMGLDLASKIRQDDYIGTLEDGNMYILLSNSNNKDADFVIKRIKSAGYPCVLMEDFGL